MILKSTAVVCFQSQISFSKLWSVNRVFAQNQDWILKADTPHHRVKSWLVIVLTCQSFGKHSRQSICVAQTRFWSKRLIVFFTFKYIFFRILRLLRMFIITFFWQDFRTAPYICYAYSSLFKENNSVRCSARFETRAHYLLCKVIGYPNELQTNRELNPTKSWDLDGELFLWTLPRFSLDVDNLNRDLDVGNSTVIHRLRLNRDLSWIIIAI